MARVRSRTKETIIQVPVAHLQPNPWGTQVGPQLADEDYEMLRLSIKDDGVQIPLVAWRRGKRLVVLSGSNRLRIARELGLRTVPVIVRVFRDKRAAKTFAISDNLARRHLTTGQRAYLAYQYQQMLRVGAGRPRKRDILSNSTKINARQIAAEKAGVSGSTVSAIKMVVESGDDELLQSVLNGERTLHAAAQIVRSNGVPARPARLSRAERQRRVDVTTLLRGDCRKELKNLAAASVDAVVCDPPYPCIGKDYGRMGEAEWLAMMKNVVGECRRVLKPTGSAVFLVQPNYDTVGRMRLWAWRFVLWAAEEWNLVQDAYWWCTNAPPTHSASRKVGLMRQAVKWCVWLGARDCYRNQDTVLWDVSDATAALRWEDRCLGRRPSGHSMRPGRSAEASLDRGGSTPFNLLPVSAANPAEHRGHPATTPYAIADWWTRYVLPSGGVLLDPFCGSGTMLAAGLDNGASSVIGIDKEARYLKMAMKRIREG
jgi:DNA modification methylase